MDTSEHATTETTAPPAKKGLGLGSLVSTILWLVTFLSALGAGCGVMFEMSGAGSAPQQAAAAAMFVSYAVVPYVIARAFDSLRR